MSAFVFLLLLNTLAFMSLDFFTPSQTAASGADGVCFTDDPNDPDCTPPDFNNGDYCNTHPTAIHSARHTSVRVRMATCTPNRQELCVSTLRRIASR